MGEGDVTEKHMDKLAPFKVCPKCGKPLHVRHVEEVVEKKDEIVPEEKVSLPAASASTYPVLGNPPNPPVVRVDEAFEEDYYTETYRCSRCGYTWTEQHEDLKDLGHSGAPSDV